MQNEPAEVTLKQILQAKTLYLFILIGLLLTSALYALVSFINIFIWWIWFGEGADSDKIYHPVVAQLYIISPLIIIYVIYCLLIYKSLKSNNLPRVKSFIILMLLMIVVHLMRHVLLSLIFSTPDMII
jgi:hypothetical protein